MSDNDPGPEYIAQAKADLPPFGPPEPLDMVHTPTFLEGKHTVERYIRINVTRNSRGHNSDCTVSVTSTAPQKVLEMELRDLLIMAADLSEQEIQRQKIEQYEAEAANSI